MKGNILPIMMYGSKCLTQKAEPVEFFDEELKQLVADLRATCENTPNGVGLAAPQVGVMARVFVGYEHQVFINPVAKLKGVNKGHRESCLSIPGDEIIDATRRMLVGGIVLRPKIVRLTWQDENGDEHKGMFEHFAGRIIQHELDHLNGICYPERLKPEDLNKIKEHLDMLESKELPNNWDLYPVEWD